VLWQSEKYYNPIQKYKNDLLREWLEEDKPIDQSDEIFEDDVDPLGISNLFMPGSIVAIGCGVALGVGILERIWGSKLRVQITEHDIWKQ